jgi:hypothetical protein
VEGGRVFLGKILSESLIVQNVEVVGANQVVESFSGLMREMTLASVSREGIMGRDEIDFVECQMNSFGILSMQQRLPRKPERPLS